ncbi:MAG: glucose-6-phosphate dehydrogenase [Patescibacteria group bacterium]|jgi:glucose-6-phosphate 1-dehydrogenase
MLPPTILVLFGATGDLVAKKILPALLHLSQKGKLPEQHTIVAFGRREMTTETFREYVRGIIGNEHPDFLKNFVYQRGQFDALEDYHALAATLDPQANHLFYLAVPPELDTMIFDGLRESGLAAQQTGGPARRIIVEKPIGISAENATEIEAALCKSFDESQIYRIDHYLAKEMVQNILSFRFSNSLFEQSWNNRFIEKIEIRLWEALGVEKRGPFYDGLGALRDVGQNHLLQMLAFVAMEHPQNFEAASIRNKRAEVLETLEILSSEEVASKTRRGQYEGYRAIEGVMPDSDTETYFKIEATLNTPRWNGVPITMESGKRMGEARKEIVVTFKEPNECLCATDTDEHQRNVVTFGLEPTEGIMIEFWSKKPGLDFEVEKRSLDFMLREKGERAQYVEEYEKLLLDGFLGDQTLFVDKNEVKAMWRYIDPIVNGWNEGIAPLETYMPDTKTIAEKEISTTVTEKAKPELAILGLGKMGGNMAKRMVEQGWRVVGWNRTHAVAEELSKDGIEPAASFDEVISKLKTPRIVWLMLPAGDATEEALFGEHGIAKKLSSGDTVIDGGNSYFKDAAGRAEKLKALGINYLDCGTSGGPGGARRGACLMIGGDRATFEKIERLFRDFALPGGYQFFDGHGAGHFVKMVHNGIEYGMMQAIAEGFEVMKLSNFKLDLTRVTDIYNHGSVIESRLVAWLKDGFNAYTTELEGISSTVAHTGEGAWTVQSAKEMGIEIPIIEGSLEFRKLSEQNPRYAGKVLSALRNQFGGHKAT